MAVHIEACAFGRMTINGRIYSSDLMIFPDGQIADNWWRESGHCFDMLDIEPLVETHPDIIVAGTGIHGMVHVSETLVTALSRGGIELQASKTPIAARTFNRLAKAGKHVAGCFHLTC